MFQNSSGSDLLNLIRENQISLMGGGDNIAIRDKVVLVKHSVWLKVFGKRRKKKIVFKFSSRLLSSVLSQPWLQEEAVKWKRPNNRVWSTIISHKGKAEKSFNYSKHTLTSAAANSQLFSS